MSRYPTKPTLLLSNRDPSFSLGIIDECNALGWRIVNLRYMQTYMMANLSPIGAILVDVPWGPELDLMRKTGIPIVCTREQDAEDFQQDGRVFYDRLGAGRLAAEAFTERGFKDLAFISTTSPFGGDSLYDGFCEAAEQHGATVHLGEIAVPSAGMAPIEKEKLQHKTLTKFFIDRPKPMAVLAYNYRMAVRVIAACEAGGLSVPEQVVVASHNNDDTLFETAPVPLSGIDVNRHEVGTQAVRLMKRMVDGEAPPKDPIYVPVKGFVERRSTDILAISAPRVAKAVRFMWDHLDLPLKIEDVADEVGTSVSTLKQEFRKSLSRGIYAELRRKRLERCKELLRGTSMNLAEIAKATGLTSSRNLHRAFKSAFAMTPNEYRKQKQ